MSNGAAVMWFFPGQGCEVLKASKVFLDLSKLLYVFKTSPDKFMAKTACLPALACLLLHYSVAIAADIPDSVVEECTTGNRTYFPTVIKVNEGIGPEQKLSAIMDALDGTWLYEGENEDAVFAGYHVRKHYLRFAIIHRAEDIITIICDSENMKQREYSIHRKAPVWKESLNSRIRWRISELTKKIKTDGLHLAKLTELYNSGFITRQEFETIKSRILAQ